LSYSFIFPPDFCEHLAVFTFVSCGGSRRQAESEKPWAMGAGLPVEVFQ